MKIVPVILSGTRLWPLSSFVISQNEGLLDTEKMMNNNQVSSLIVIVYYLVLCKYMVYKLGKNPLTLV
jgi:hypothetical protein